MSWKLIVILMWALMFAPVFVPPAACEVIQDPLERVGHYDLQGNGTAIDIKSSLMWQVSDVQNYLGDVQTPNPRDWYQAWSFCSQLMLGGYDDWRIPSKAELQGICETPSGWAEGQPQIDSRVFPDCLADGYWTSTQVDDSAYVVSFDNNIVYPYGKGSVFYVRCVRQNY